MTDQPDQAESGWKTLTISARGFLFNSDGVLLDTTAIVERRWREFAHEHGLDPAEVLGNVHSRRTADVIGDLAAKLATPVDEAIEAFAAKDRNDLVGIGILPGAQRTLAELPPFTWAVVTSAKADVALARLAGAGLEVPRYLVTGDDVPEGKPDPAPYLRGAELLGLPPEDCLVIEDAPPGLISATRAGRQTLGLLTTHTREECRLLTTSPPTSPTSRSFTCLASGRASRCRPRPGRLTRRLIRDGRELAELPSHVEIGGAGERVQHGGHLVGEVLRLPNPGQCPRAVLLQRVGVSVFHGALQR